MIRTALCGTSAMGLPPLVLSKQGSTVSPCGKLRLMGWLSSLSLKCGPHHSHVAKCNLPVLDLKLHKEKQKGDATSLSTGSRSYTQPLFPNPISQDTVGRTMAPKTLMSESLNQCLCPLRLRFLRWGGHHGSPTRTLCTV